MPETATEKARRLRDEKRKGNAAKRTSPGSTSSKPASLLPLASKSPTKGTTKLAGLGRSTSTSGASASGPRKSRPGGVTLEVGGYVSVSGKTKPAMLQMDNDDGTWDVEYLGGEEAKVKESQMKRVLGSQQRQIDQAKAAEKKAGGASKTAAGDLSNADPNDFKAGDLDSSKPVEDKPSKASTSTGRTSLARSTSRESATARRRKEDERRREDERKRKDEDEARRKKETDSKRKKEDDAKRKKEDDAKRKEKEEARDSKRAEQDKKAEEEREAAVKKEDDKTEQLHAKETENSKARKLVDSVGADGSSCLWMLNDEEERKKGHIVEARRGEPKYHRGLRALAVKENFTELSKILELDEAAVQALGDKDAKRAAEKLRTRAAERKKQIEERNAEGFANAEFVG